MYLRTCEVDYDDYPNCSIEVVPVDTPKYIFHNKLFYIPMQNGYFVYHNQGGTQMGKGAKNVKYAWTLCTTSGPDLKLRVITLSGWLKLSYIEEYF